MEKEEGVPPGDDMPVQGIFDPETGRNITGEVAESYRKEAEQALPDVWRRALVNLVSGKDMGHAMDSAREEIYGILDRRYTSLKLPVDEDELANLSGQLGTLLVAYSGLLDDLRDIQELAEDIGYDCRLSTEPEQSFYLDWEAPMEPVHMIFSRAGALKGTLLAFPFCTMRTNAYGPFFLGGEPPAADIIHATGSGLIFVSQESTPPEEILNLLAQERQNHSEIVPMLSFEQLRNLAEVTLTDPTCVDVAAEPSDAEIKEIIFGELPEIMAIGIVVSGYPEKTIHPRNELPSFP